MTHEKYPLVSRLFGEGIAAALSFAMERHGYIPAESYAGKCDLCRDIRKHLVLTLGLELPDAMPRGHYLYA